METPISAHHTSPIKKSTDQRQMMANGTRLTPLKRHDH